MSLVADRSDTRTRILDAAERLFREVGYQKTTVADIARALGMSPANVYRFFDSKRAINEAVAARLTDQIATALEAAARADAPAAVRLREVLTTLYRLVTELGMSQARMLDMVEAAMAENWEVVRAHIVQLDAILIGLVRDGVASGEFTADPDRAGPCIRAAMIRFSHPAIMAQTADLPRPTLDDQIDFVLAALKHRPPP